MFWMWSETLSATMIQNMASSGCLIADKKIYKYN